MAIAVKGLIPPGLVEDEKVLLRQKFLCFQPLQPDGRPDFSRHLRVEAGCGVSQLKDPVEELGVRS